MTVAAAGALVPQTLLENCRKRAPGYDRDNKFCQEDFDELKAAGYLKMAVPREFGGLGFTLADVARETRRLASYAPATALCINMHNYWVGTAADVLAQRRQVGRVDPARRGCRRSIRGRPRRERQRNLDPDVGDEGRESRRRLSASPAASPSAA